MLVHDCVGAAPIDVVRVLDMKPERQSKVLTDGGALGRNETDRVAPIVHDRKSCV